MVACGTLPPKTPGDPVASYKELLVLMTATAYDDHTTPHATEAEETDGRYSEELHDHWSAEA